MMGWQTGDQRQLFYLFNLERRIPASHLLRRINPIVMQVLADLREKLAPFYSDIGRPSIDPELMIRMLIVGYCYGIRFERRLCEEVELHLAYRWFCRLDLDDKVPDHSTFSVNRHGRFRDSNILRHVFEAVVRACMNAGLVKGEGFAVDAASGICRECWPHIRLITTSRARTWRWRRMRRYDELSRGAERSSPRQFFPDCTITMCGYDFREGQRC
jgi:transposase